VLQLQQYRDKKVGEFGRGLCSPSWFNQKRGKAGPRRIVTFGTLYNERRMRDTREFIEGLNADTTTQIAKHLRCATQPGK
jgi:hypothetical protein